MYRRLRLENRQIDMSRVIRRAIDLLFRRNVIRCGSPENIRDKFLWIPVNYREPGALHLDH